MPKSTVATALQAAGVPVTEEAEGRWSHTPEYMFCRLHGTSPAAIQVALIRYWARRGWDWEAELRDTQE